MNEQLGYAVNAHVYFDVDLDALWAAVNEDLPDLKRCIEIILKAET
jgi:uncharacterized protein with HEPN domain